MFWSALNWFAEMINSIFEKYQILFSIIEPSEYISGWLGYSYMDVPEVALRRCSSKKFFWKYAENLQPTHAKVWFQ